MPKDAEDACCAIGAQLGLTTDNTIELVDAIDRLLCPKNTDCDKILKDWKINPADYGFLHEKYFPDKLPQDFDAAGKAIGGAVGKVAGMAIGIIIGISLLGVLFTVLIVYLIMRMVRK